MHRSAPSQPLGRPVVAVDRLRPRRTCASGCVRLSDCLTVFQVECACVCVCFRRVYGEEEWLVWKQPD